jgi:prepilin-type N-terminal cleavage/methylation domain-containing protein
MNADCHPGPVSCRQNSEDGFTLTEFLVAALILLVVSSAVFSLLSEIQRTAGYQSEVQSVLNSTRIAMETMERCIRQAGNDPFGSGLSGITIVNASEVRIRSDLTGSAGAANPDKGDPDGDINDSGEDVTIRYNAISRSLEIVPDGGSPQIVAGYISGLSFQYYDADGNVTADGKDVRKIAIDISGATQEPNPQTHRIFGIRLSSEIRILS